VIAAGQLGSLRWGAGATRAPLSRGLCGRTNRSGGFDRPASEGANSFAASSRSTTCRTATNLREGHRYRRSSDKPRRAPAEARRRVPRWPSPATPGSHRRRSDSGHSPLRSHTETVGRTNRRNPPNRGVMRSSHGRRPANTPELAANIGWIVRSALSLKSAMPLPQSRRYGRGAWPLNPRRFGAIGRLPQALESGPIQRSLPLNPLG
jgi:hypothetical protein